MVRKYFFLILCSLCVFFDVNAQAYNPDYSDFEGVATMSLPNGWYYGEIKSGYPEGEGYAYFKDSQLGWVVYKGSFCNGSFSGEGAVVCDAGFLEGTWRKNKLTNRVFNDRDHIMSVCNDIKEVFQNKIQKQYLDLAEIVLPGGNTALVEQISDDTMLGKKTLRSFSK